MSDLVRFQAELQRFQNERDFLQQSINVSRMGHSYLQGQTTMLKEGNTAVTKEIEKMAKQTKANHENFLH
jgi:hypothetical protein